MVLLSILLGVVMEGVRHLVSSWLDAQTFSGAVASCLAAGLIFIALLYPSLKVLKIDDILEILNGPLKKVKALIF